MLKNVGLQIFSGMSMIGEAVMMPLQVLSVFIYYWWSGVSMQPRLSRALPRDWWIGIMLLRLENGLKHDWRSK